MDNELPADVLERIELEAKQFAFYNYVSAANHPSAIFENMETWPLYAAVCYRSIKSYMAGQGLYWPHKRPRLSTEYATKLHMAEQENAKLKQTNTILDTASSTLNDQVNEARALLEKVASRHEAGLLPDRFIYQEIKNFLDGTK